MANLVRFCTGLCRLSETHHHLSPESSAARKQTHAHNTVLLLHATGRGVGPSLATAGDPDRGHGHGGAALEAEAAGPLAAAAGAIAAEAAVAAPDPAPPREGESETTHRAPPHEGETIESARPRLAAGGMTASALRQVRTGVVGKSGAPGGTATPGAETGTKLGKRVFLRSGGYIGRHP